MNKLSRRSRFFLHLLGLTIGVFLGAVVIFTFFFLAKVLPHGGF